MRRPNTQHVRLWYPRSENLARTAAEPQAIEIDLFDVRAASRIRITYDFDRDGYVITMKPTRELGGVMEETGDWQEVAFVNAWLEP